MAYPSSCRRVTISHMASAELKFAGTMQAVGIVMSNASSSSATSARMMSESR